MKQHTPRSLRWQHYSINGQDPLVYTCIPGIHPEYHVLITAGMDGDEYTGIEAAHRLARHFQTHIPQVSLTIFPCVNVAGNRKGISANPEDGIFPKHIFPGDPKGSNTFQRIAWLWSHTVPRPDVWIDIHGGDRTEWLIPFIWGFPQYGTASTRLVSKQLLSAVANDRLVTAPWAKAERISTYGTVYIILESGELGTIDEMDVERHVQWVNCLIENILSPQKVSGDLHTYASLSTIKAPISGMYSCMFDYHQVVSPHTVLGQIVTATGTHTVHSNLEGLPLWGLQHKSVTKGEVLCTIATSPQVYRQ